MTVLYSSKYMLPFHLLAIISCTFGSELEIGDKSVTTLNLQRGATATHNVAVGQHGEPAGRKIFRTAQP